MREHLSAIPYHECGSESNEYVTICWNLYGLQTIMLQNQ